MSKRSLAISAAKSFILRALDDLPPSEKAQWAVVIRNELSRLGLLGPDMEERIRQIQEDLYLFDWILHAIEADERVTQKMRDEACAQINVKLAELARDLNSLVPIVLEEDEDRGE